MPQETPQQESPDRQARSFEGGDGDRHRRRFRRWLIIAAMAAGLLTAGLTVCRHWLIEYFTTVSTDDAYVHGHVSAISTRVSGHVTAIYVDDNDRVCKGDLLLELDHEPYKVIVAQKEAALAVAEASLAAAEAQARGQEAAARAGRFALVNAQEQVRYRIAACTPTSLTCASRRPTSSWPARTSSGSRRSPPRGRRPRKRWISGRPSAERGARPAPRSAFPPTKRTPPPSPRISSRNFPPFSMALGELYRQVQQQAQALSYFDVLWLFSLGGLLVVPLVFLMRRSVSEKPGGVGVP